jgi:S-adenosylmethionine hydrolase
MPIALLTDFGTTDSYAGILKGMIAKIAPEARVIDLTHEILPYDLLQAGLILYQSYRYFPPHTIFVCVVDPGVGSERRPILIKTKNYFFIGPDNGLFTLALADQEIEKVIHLTQSQYFLEPLSSTFHGRDIFTPVAAHLSLGIPADQFGPEVSDYKRLEDFFPQVEKKEIVGKILSIDRFGNAITNLSHSFLKKHISDLKFSLSIGKRKLSAMKTHYAEGEKKKPFFLFGSSGLLEIAMNQGSAAHLLKMKRGDFVRIKVATSSPMHAR